MDGPRVCVRAWAFKTLCVCVNGAIHLLHGTSANTRTCARTRTHSFIPAAQPRTWWVAKNEQRHGDGHLDVARAQPVLRALCVCMCVCGGDQAKWRARFSQAPSDEKWPANQAIRQLRNHTHATRTLRTRTSTME